MLRSLFTSLRALPPSFGVFVLSLSFAIIAFGLHHAPAVYAYGLYAAPDLSFSQNARRAALLRQSMDTPAVLETLSADDVRLVLRNPSLVRYENDVQAWHYHGESCAIDIYFKGEKASRPAYVEFRALTLNKAVEDRFAETDDRSTSRYCLKNVLAEQGVDTPSSYARRPLPSWPSPYSS